MKVLRAGEDYPTSAARFVLGQLRQLEPRADPAFNSKITHPAYKRTHPRILLDEAHHNVYTAAGLSKPFVELMANDGYMVTPNRNVLTRTALENAEILVIANPLGTERTTGPDDDAPGFTDAECDAVRWWVRDGGALLLAVHGNPSVAAAAELAMQFGVELSAGGFDDRENSEVNHRDLVFSRMKRLLGDHPITAGRDDSERLTRVACFLFGGAIKGPSDSVPFLKLSETATVIMRRGAKPAPAAGRVHGLALRFGKGRVVVLGDASPVSAQLFGPGRLPMGMNMPGTDNRQMTLNIMHWLSGLIGESPRSDQPN